MTEKSLKARRLPAITKIVSGGQTGADRAALDAAIATGRSYGGWLPKGRKAEDGPLSQSYALQEMENSDYSLRTEQNVLDSDGTLIVSHGELTGGSLLTRVLAEKHRRPHLHIDLESCSIDEATERVSDWLSDERIKVLNVAGPRASGDPQIYGAVRELVGRLLSPGGEDCC